MLFAGLGSIRAVKICDLGHGFSDTGARISTNFNPGHSLYILALCGFDCCEIY